MYTKNLCQTEWERNPENKLLRLNRKFVIPFRLMVDVAVRKLFYAVCILVTLV